MLLLLQLACVSEPVDLTTVDPATAVPTPAQPASPTEPATEPVDPTPEPTVEPCSPDDPPPGRLLFLLGQSGTGDSLIGFRVAADGGLLELPDSPWPTSGASTDGPADLVAIDGQLIASHADAGVLDVWNIDACGVPTAVTGSPFFTGAPVQYLRANGPEDRVYASSDGAIETLGRDADGVLTTLDRWDASTAVFDLGWMPDDVLVHAGPGGVTLQETDADGLPVGRFNYSFAGVVQPRAIVVHPNGETVWIRGDGAEGLHTYEYGSPTWFFSLSDHGLLAGDTLALEGAWLYAPERAGSLGVLEVGPDGTTTPTRIATVETAPDAVSLATRPGLLALSTPSGVESFVLGADGVPVAADAVATPAGPLAFLD